MGGNGREESREYKKRNENFKIVFWNVAGLVNKGKNFWIEVMNIVMGHCVN